MHLKICGLKDPSQARQVAGLGVDAIGVIGVSSSPRHVPATDRGALFAAIAATAPNTARVLVLANPTDAEVEAMGAEGRGGAAMGGDGGATVVQLHGHESPERCRSLRRRLGLPIWKALRIREPGDLNQVESYASAVDALLLDAWVPDQLGGSGARIPIEWLDHFQPSLPWWLAGGVSAERVPMILAKLQPYGLDASSSVELAPGLKDPGKVQQLIEAVRSAGTTGAETART